jgi:hypothetical protein
MASAHRLFFDHLGYFQLRPVLDLLSLLPVKKHELMKQPPSTTSFSILIILVTCFQLLSCQKDAQLAPGQMREVTARGVRPSALAVFSNTYAAGAGNGNLTIGGNVMPTVAASPFCTYLFETNLFKIQSFEKPHPGQ